MRDMRDWRDGQNWGQGMEGRPECWACYYFCNVYHDETSDWGDCRRRAPTDKKWPVVGMHSWCGEFVRWDKEVIPYEDVAYATEQERAEIRDNTGVADEELFLTRWRPTPRKVKPATKPGSPAKGEGE